MSVCDHSNHKRCECPCHASNGKMMHIMACCLPCPSCGFRVDTHKMGLKERDDLWKSMSNIKKTN